MKIGNKKFMLIVEISCSE